jgi:hypothetical protein
MVLILSEVLNLSIDYLLFISLINDDKKQIRENQF